MFITGSGVLSCAGHSPSDLWNANLAGKSLTKEGLGFVRQHASTQSGDKAYDFFIAAAQQAMESAGWSELTEDDGVIIGTTTGQILLWDNAYVQFIKQQSSFKDFQKSFALQPLGSILTRACARLGRTPHQMLITSACTASTQALAMACMWLEQKKVKRVLVGGVEVLCDLTIEGFKSLQLLSTTPCKPFDQERKGINLSEGAAFLCLEATPKKKSLAVISGYGMTTDAFHITSPHPEGRGSALAMKKALASAGLLAADIDWIHGHGTGSTANDLAEAAAVAEVFGNAEHEKSPWVTSTKGVHGHMLAGSGILESVLCVEALKHQQILKTTGLQQQDSKIHLRHPNDHKSMRLRHILKNTLGFGGANASVIISHAEAGHL